MSDESDEAIEAMKTAMQIWESKMLAWAWDFLEEHGFTVHAPVDEL